MKYSQSMFEDTRKLDIKDLIRDEVVNEIKGYFKIYNKFINMPATITIRVCALYDALNILPSGSNEEEILTLEDEYSDIAKDYNLTEQDIIKHHINLKILRIREQYGYKDDSDGNSGSASKKNKMKSNLFSSGSQIIK